jgi:transcriptional regulator with XRE-family HTH domain
MLVDSAPAPSYSVDVQNTSTPDPSPLRAARIANGYGLRHTAREAKIDPGQLARIEKGQGGLTVSGLYRLAVVLGLRDLAKHLRPFAGARPRAGD